MTKIKKTYTFSGLGFDVLLHNIEIKEARGIEYPVINMNEIKLLTATGLNAPQERQLRIYARKFLRFRETAY